MPKVRFFQFGWNSHLLGTLIYLKLYLELCHSTLLKLTINRDMSNGRNVVPHFYVDIHVHILSFKSFFLALRSISKLYFLLPTLQLLRKPPSKPPKKWCSPLDTGNIVPLHLITDQEGAFLNFVTVKKELWLVALSRKEGYLPYSRWPAKSDGIQTSFYIIITTLLFFIKSHTIRCLTIIERSRDLFFVETTLPVSQVSLAFVPSTVPLD